MLDKQLTTLISNNEEKAMLPCLNLVDLFEIAKFL